MTKSELVHKVEACIPKLLVSAYRNGKRFYYWKRQQLVYKISVRKVRKKQTPLNVVFLVQYASVWKYDSVFRAMQNDPTFCPIVFVCPLVDLPKEEMLYRLHQGVEYFEVRGFPVMSGYDEQAESCLSLDSIYPDIVFYTTLWSKYTHPMYDEYHLRSRLKCYVNYGFCSIAEDWGVASRFHGLMWRNFSECEDLRQLALSINNREMQNLVVTGYPIYDEYQLAREDDSCWKCNSPDYKRVIWAPHHTIEGRDGLLKLSTFLENADVMMRIAEKYRERIQFAFKPHPQLKSALYDHPNWGKEKTDKYYAQWANGENTTLVDGPYMSLFKSSNAMIHDCGSFIVEYLYTKNPVLYMANYDREGQSNIVGRKAFKAHYHGYNECDIENFIANVVLQGKDNLANERANFYHDVLLPPNGCTAAENILNTIKKELRR